MAETNYEMVVNGLSINEEDVNQISNQASFADDRVLWELFRMQKYSGSGPQKAITTYGVQGNLNEYALDTNALISGNTADATIRVLPFRAFIGSLDNTDSKTEKREIRSGYAIGSTGPTELVLGANASGNPRWDLIKVAVVPSQQATNVTRYIKDPITTVVSATSLSINTSVACTVSVTQGIPAATPTRPAVPADTADTYYIVLGYVYVPTGFGASSITTKYHIHESAPILTLHEAVGGHAVKPANHCHKIGGSIDINQSGATQTTFRPGAYLPSTMVGGESRIILVQTGFSPKSHNDGDVIDDSVDWRYRYFRWTAYVQGPDTSPSSNTVAAAFASDPRGTGFYLLPAATPGGQSPGSRTITRLGQSMYNDTLNYFNSDSTYHGNAVYMTDLDLDLSSPGSNAFSIVVDGSGRLVVRYQASVLAQVLIWLEATGQYNNFGLI